MRCVGDSNLRLFCRRRSVMAVERSDYLLNCGGLGLVRIYERISTV